MSDSDKVILQQEFAENIVSKPIKRKREGSESFQSVKRLCHSPQPILNWLDSLPPSQSPKSAPPSLCVSQLPFDRYEEMSQISTLSRDDSTSTRTTRSKAKADKRAYRDILAKHKIIILTRAIDPPAEITTLLETYITKDRPIGLSDEEINTTRKKIFALRNQSELQLLDILNLPLFSLSRDGLASGANTTWTADALPTRLDYPEGLCAPRPDRQYGYPPTEETNFTVEEEKVISNPYALPYTQPALETRLPFLVVEAKSEACGKPIWYAENQAAGGGTHCVASHRWLLQQASLNEDPTNVVSPTPDQAVAFSICFTGRQAWLYIHYYWEGSYHMLPVSDYTLEVRQDIQLCYKECQNVLDYGLITRRNAINGTLKKLWPIPEQWSRKRKASEEAVGPPNHSSDILPGEAVQG